MAKNIVGDLKLKLGVENEKVLSELKGSLRGIASVAKVSGKDLLQIAEAVKNYSCLLYTSPSPRDATLSRMPSSA